MKQLIQCMGMLMLLFGLSSRVSAQITLVKDGKATSRMEENKPQPEKTVFC